MFSLTAPATAPLINAEENEYSIAIDQTFDGEQAVTSSHNIIHFETGSFSNEDGTWRLYPGGYISNTTRLGGITKLSVNFDEYNSGSLKVLSSFGDKDYTLAEPITIASSGTFPTPDYPDFLYIEPISSCLINSLTITYNCSPTSTAKHLVTFNSDGGSDVSAKKVLHGHTITAPENPTKPNFRFAGWLLDSNPFDFSSPIENDITLSAKWVTTTLELNDVTVDKANKKGLYINTNFDFGKDWASLDTAWNVLVDGKPVEKNRVLASEFGTNTVFIEPKNLNAVDGTTVTFKSGFSVTKGEDTLTLANDVNFVYLEGAGWWKPTSIKTLSLAIDPNANANTFYFNLGVPLEGAVQWVPLTSGSNASTSVTIKGVPFSPTANGMQCAWNNQIIYIDNIGATNGSKISFAKGFRIIYNDVLYVTNKEYNYVYNGSKWELAPIDLSIIKAYVEYSNKSNLLVEIDRDTLEYAELYHEMPFSGVAKLNDTNVTSTLKIITNWAKCLAIKGFGEAKVNDVLTISSGSSILAGSQRLNFTGEYRFVYSASGWTKVSMKSLQAEGSFIRVADLPPNPFLVSELAEYKGLGLNTCLLTEDYCPMVDSSTGTLTSQYKEALQNIGSASLSCWIRNQYNDPDYFENQDDEIIRHGNGYDYTLSKRNITTEFASYPHVTGFYMADEPTMGALSDGRYQKMVNWKNTNFTDSFFHMNLFPSYGGEALGGASFDQYIQKYVDEIASGVNGNKTICLDNYPFAASSSGIRPSYLTDIAKAATLAKNYNDGNQAERLTFGVCLQCFKDSGLKDIEMSEEESFQMYVGMAFGARLFEYFGYESINDSIIGIMDKNRQRRLYDYVLEANANTLSLEKYLLAFDYSGFLLSKASSWFNQHNNEAFDSVNSLALSSTDRLSSFSSSEDALIGYFKKEEEDGYMVVNYTAPKSDKNNSVTLNFTNCRYVMVHQKGKDTIMPLISGRLTLNLNKGEGAFVIPLR